MTGFSLLLPSASHHHTRRAISSTNTKTRQSRSISCHVLCCLLRFRLETQTNYSLGHQSFLGILNIRLSHRLVTQPCRNHHRLKSLEHDIAEISDTDWFQFGQLRSTSQHQSRLAIVHQNPHLTGQQTFSNPKTTQHRSPKLLLHTYHTKTFWVREHISRNATVIC